MDAFVLGAPHVTARCARRDVERARDRRAAIRAIVD